MGLACRWSLSIESLEHFNNWFQRTASRISSAWVTLPMRIGGKSSWKIENKVINKLCHFIWFEIERISTRLKNYEQLMNKLISGFGEPPLRKKNEDTKRKWIQCREEETLSQHWNLHTEAKPWENRETWLSTNLVEPNARIAWPHTHTSVFSHTDVA